MTDTDIQADVITESMPDTPEKLFTQEEVNKLIGKRKQRAANAAASAVQAQYADEIEALRNQQDERNQEIPRDVDINAIAQQVQRKISEDLNRRQLEQEMNHAAQKYTSSLEVGRADYPDFDEVTGDFEPENMPQLTYLMANMDNAADILYEISKNPQKLATLDYLALRNPNKARTELLKLSRSIVQNKQAVAEHQESQTREPLDRLSPSRISGDNGKMGIKDLRSQSWLR